MPKPARSPKHLTFIRSLPCALCGRPNSDAHHLLRGVVRGMGMRAGDDCAIPLCSGHHRGLHADGNERRYLTIDGPALAAALWAATGDHKAAENAVMRARNALP